MAASRAVVWWPPPPPPPPPPAPLRLSPVAASSRTASRAFSTRDLLPALVGSAAAVHATRCVGAGGGQGGGRVWRSVWASG